MNTFRGECEARAETNRNERKALHAAEEMDKHR